MPGTPWCSPPVPGKDSRFRPVRGGARSRIATPRDLVSKDHRPTGHEASRRPGPIPAVQCSGPAGSRTPPARGCAAARRDSPHGHAMCADGRVHPGPPAGISGCVPQPASCRRLPDRGANPGLRRRRHGQPESRQRAHERPAPSRSMFEISRRNRQWHREPAHRPPRRSRRRTAHSVRRQPSHQASLPTTASAACRAHLCAGRPVALPRASGDRGTVPSTIRRRGDGRQTGIDHDRPLHRLSLPTLTCALATGAAPSGCRSRSASCGRPRRRSGTARDRVRSASDRPDRAPRDRHAAAPARPDPSG